ncbi:MAG: hypothetical protein KDE33_25740 [Bacteroidetes bacterium]|nr:hypothetical protein [Bacteroidota bacterium]
MKDDLIDKVPSIKCYIKPNKMKHFIIYAMIIPGFIACETRSPVLKAILIDDLSSINLNLYSDNTFQIYSNDLMGEGDSYLGKFQLRGDTIIFLDKPYHNDFIPDKIFKVEDKLIRAYKDDGSIDTSFASFFEILKNDLMIN